MKNPIVYDVNELKWKLEQNLDALDRIRYNDKYAQYLGAEFVAQITHWARNIRRQKELPFTIVVCGEFKRGKSSLINALLGEDVVVTDVAPETITLNRISYGAHSNALILPGGKRMLLSDEQLCRDNLEDILESQGDGTYQLEIKRPIEMLKSFTIVDTPGMEDSMQDFTPVVMEALNQADAVVYVFSVNYPISRKEQLFIKSVLLPQKHTDVFAVGNFMDVLRTKENCTRMSKEIETRLESILPGVPFYLLSALDERCRQLHAERPCENLADMLEENFRQIRDRLVTLVEEKSNMVLPDRMERMFKGMLNEANAQLNALEYGITIDRETIHKEREEARETCASMEQNQQATLNKLSHIIKEMRLETQEWMSELIEQMRREADLLKDDAIADVRKFYSIYCVDTLQDALTRCVEYHLECLYDEVDRVSDEAGKHFTLDTSKLEKQSFRFALHNKTWTKGDNVYFGTQMVGSYIYMNQLKTLIAFGIAGHMREKELKGKKDTVLRDVQTQFTQLERSLPDILKRYYEQVESELNDQIQAFFAGQIASIEANAVKVTEAANRSDDEKHLVQQTIVEVRTILKDMTI